MSQGLKELYDVEQLINFEKIKSILENQKEKKILCFGGGTAGEILMKQLLYQYNIICFLDNNEELFGKKISGVEIQSPESIKQMKQGTFFILILSKHVRAITQQLESYGLVDGKDFIDIYKEFNKYFAVKKFQVYTESYIDFINRIPSDIFDNITEKEPEKHIGVVTIASMVALQSWYAVTLYLMAKYKGCHVTLIVDNLSAFDEELYFPEHHEITTLYTNHVITILQNRFHNIDVCYINDDSPVAELSDEDIAEAKRLAKVTTAWQAPRWDEMDDVPTDEMEKCFFGILERNMKIIKRFFQMHSFDLINVISALHKHRGLYMWEGSRYHMQVSSYDGVGGNKTTVCATNYPCSHAHDVVRMVKEDFLDSQSRSEIVKLAKQDFTERIRATFEDGGYNFQYTASLAENQKIYDVILPLNINFDAACLGQDYLFESEGQWIFDTIDFILKETTASVMIREHPATHIEIYKEFDIISYETDIKQKYEDNPRIYFCAADAPVNTYRMIEKCKVVLPYSSTVGVEAVLLGKPVITHTNAYYSKLDFAYHANTKEEYFAYIKMALNNVLEPLSYRIEDVYIAYWSSRNISLKSIFREIEDEWVNYSLCELLDMPDVNDIFDVLFNSIPASYLNYKKLVEG